MLTKGRPLCHPLLWIAIRSLGGERRIDINGTVLFETKIKTQDSISKYSSKEQTGQSGSACAARRKEGRMERKKGASHHMQMETPSEA